MADSHGHVMTVADAFLKAGFPGACAMAVGPAAIGEDQGADSEQPMSTEPYEQLEELRGAVQDGRLVLFVGNGVWRVPTTSEGSSRPAEAVGVDRSWAGHMEELYRLDSLRSQRGSPRPDDLDFPSFMQLGGPRQAEWFDRRVEADTGTSRKSMPRLHLLGRTLHRDDGIPVNDLFHASSRLISRLCSAGADVDVITTNVDCALEQNVARRLERDGIDDADIRIVHPDMRSERWSRNGDASRVVHLWKIHGCLRAFRRKHSPGWKKLLADLSRARGADDPWLTKLRRPKPVAGFIPERELFTHGSWRCDQELVPEETGVFAVSEYFKLLARLLRSRGGDAERFKSLFESRPMLFVGFELGDEELDIVALLQSFGSDQALRTTLRFGDPSERPHEAERLRQLGVRWWPFDLPGIGRATLPGYLTQAAWHEWRFGQDFRTPLAADRSELVRRLRSDFENPWRVELQRAKDTEWLVAQVRQPEDLLDRNVGEVAAAGPLGAPQRSRLVVAGLASLWHALGLKKAADFPNRRRVSAGLAAVDSRVPGGSGLVPAMVAAVAAGPDALGRLAFLSNLPSSASSWSEIEEFCLAAGLDTRPLARAVQLNDGARTSHVLLFDAFGAESRTVRPRQRMILDVDDLVATGQTANAAAPSIVPTDGFGFAKDLLFADKLVDPTVLDSWEGLVVFETGSAGDELLTLREPPAVWTASFGSFIRTLVLARLGHVDSGGRWIVDFTQERKAALAARGRRG